jgi:hypothetical protein
MSNILHDGPVLVTMNGRVLADTAGTYLCGAGAVQLVQDRGDVAPARSAACTKTVVTRPQTLQKNPFMTHGAVNSGVSSGPHRAWDPV